MSIYKLTKLTKKLWKISLGKEEKSHHTTHIGTIEIYANISQVPHFVKTALTYFFSYCKTASVSSETIIITFRKNGVLRNV